MWPHHRMWRPTSVYWSTLTVFEPRGPPVSLPGATTAVERLSPPSSSPWKAPSCQAPGTEVRRQGPSSLLN